jgi:hypothetical protein
MSEEEREDLAYLLNAIHDAETGDVVEITVGDDAFRRLSWRTV